MVHGLHFARRMRQTVTRSTLLRARALCALALCGVALVGCGNPLRAIDPRTGEVGTFDTEAMIPAGWIPCEGACDDVTVPGTLENGAPTSMFIVYQAENFVAPGVNREWIPMDVTPSTHGELWVVQRMARLPEFDEFTECTSRAQAGSPNDCVGLQGSTVALRDPSAMSQASGERANLVVDFNAWHFMRRPSAIAFGAESTTLPADDPRALDPSTGAPLLTEAATYTDIFATCHEHWTGNFTDQAAFIGPSLWTADPAIYNGGNGEYSWSNGSHLDMVHATQNCTGIAWERDNVYWALNGEEGTLDRYDFGVPHVPGAADHDDGEVTRYQLGDALGRVVDVPSNLWMDGTVLYIADTGNGRVVRFDTAQTMTEMGSFQTFEALTGQVMGGSAETIADAATLGALWGGVSEPSGLAMLDSETLVVANHASGHITLLSVDGEEIHTFDTGLGAGIGGLAVMDGAIYFAHMGERRVYRVDVDPTPILIVPQPEG